MNYSFLLIGHRASGKTTLGRLLADDLHCPFVDLDDEIEIRTGESAAEWIRSDEATFRRIEENTFSSLRVAYPVAVFSAGGGLRTIPADLFVIWIHREGWEREAVSSRTRLRPELDAEEEIRWMKETRDQHYRLASHIQLNLESGCSVSQAGARLRILAERLIAAVGSPVMKMSWMRPRKQDDLNRCVAQARLFGMAGVEIRSDMFSETPTVSVPVLASLRSQDPVFFSRSSHAAAFDCDTEFLQKLDLRELAPRPLIFSSHPKDVYKEYFDFLISLPDFIAKAYPDWLGQLMLKYAPFIKSWIELRYANQLYKVYEKAGHTINFFPQGKKWNWMRIQRLFAGNQFNFITTGCLEHSRLPPGVDYFLHCCTTDTAPGFYGVIGENAQHSIGDLFHSACGMNNGRNKEVYVKIPLSSNEIDPCLHLLPQIGFKGLSVTSPLKRLIYDSNFVGSENEFSAGNTLTLIKGSFLLFDTDEAGMTAALEEIHQNNIHPGSVLVFGEGGVLQAVKRALNKAGWTSVQTSSARLGWGKINEKHFTLIVNASGRNVFEGAPDCDVWLDLRYQNIDIPPASTVRFFNGMTFYKHQAAAQRDIWQLTTNNEILTTF